MKLKNNVRVLIAKAGYKSLLEFAEDKELSYYLLRKLANNQTSTLEVKFIVDLCEALNCGIEELFFLEGQAS